MSAVIQRSMSTHCIAYVPLLHCYSREEKPRICQIRKWIKLVHVYNYASIKWSFVHLVTPKTLCLVTQTKHLALSGREPRTGSPFSETHFIFHFWEECIDIATVPQVEIPSEMNGKQCFHNQYFLRRKHKQKIHSPFSHLKARYRDPSCRWGFGNIEIFF